MEGESSRKARPSALKLGKESRPIRKPPVPLPAQQRQPVIIHTYSPRVIEIEASNFMWLVQSLTGSSDTRMRCKSSRPADLKSRRSKRKNSRRPQPDERDQPQWKREIEDDGREVDRPVVAQRHPQSSDDGEEDQEELLASSSPDVDDDFSSLSQQQQHQPQQHQQQQQQQQLFKMEQLLLSPASSSDSGNPLSRLCAVNPLLASPKSPLVSFEANLSFDHHHHHFPVNPFSTTSSMVSEGSVYVPQIQQQQQQQQQQQLPWSPIITPNGLSHDFLSEVDLWTVAGSFPSSSDFSSPRSRLFGSFQSPASMAFKEMAYAFVKDA